jgi:hypothetical protein
MKHLLTCLYAGAFVLATLTAASCGTDTASIPPASEGGTVPPGGGHEAGPGDDGGDSGACTGLSCNVPKCADGSEKTTLTGKVFAPNGKLALPNVNVYVPNKALDPIPAGAACCVAPSGAPIVSAVSDATGTFTLVDPPAGKNVPLVVQVGKWRRQVTVPEIKACQKNDLDADLGRLPKKQSEGDMPRIALTTGGCDSLGCMLPKVGVDTSEIGVPADGAAKAVHIYKGNGGQGPATAPSASTLWSDAKVMKDYDLLLLSCECFESLDNKGGSATAAPFGEMTTYLSGGGRVLTTDFQYTWYKNTTDPSLKTALTIPGGAPPGGQPLSVDTSFARGKNLSDWLMSVAPGPLTADAIYSNVSSLDPVRVQQWVTSPSPQGPRVFTVDMPFGAACGRALHIDAHVNNTDSVDATFPNGGGCSTTLRPAEDLLAYFFFSLAECP